MKIDTVEAQAASTRQADRCFETVWTNDQALPDFWHGNPERTSYLRRPSSWKSHVRSHDGCIARRVLSVSEGERQYALWAAVVALAGRVRPRHRRIPPPACSRMATDLNIDEQHGRTGGDGDGRRRRSPGRLAILTRGVIAGWCWTFTLLLIVSSLLAATANSLAML